MTVMRRLNPRMMFGPYAIVFVIFLSTVTPSPNHAVACSLGRISLSEVMSDYRYIIFTGRVVSHSERFWGFGNIETQFEVNRVLKGEIAGRVLLYTTNSDCTCEIQYFEVGEIVTVIAYKKGDDYYQGPTGCGPSDFR